MPPRPAGATIRAMTNPTAAIARYVLVPDPRPPVPPPAAPVRRLRLARINPVGPPKRDRSGYPHLKRVFD
jgi:hypothetical protein